MDDEIADNPEAVRPRAHEEPARPSLPRYTMESVFGSVPGRPGLSIDLDVEIEEAMADALAEKSGRLRRG